MSKPFDSWKRASSFVFFKWMTHQATNNLRRSLKQTNGLLWNLYIAVFWLLFFFFSKWKNVKPLFLRRCTWWLCTVSQHIFCFNSAWEDTELIRVTPLLSNPFCCLQKITFFLGGGGGGAFSESLRLGFTVYLSKHLGLRTTISNLFCSSLSIFCENGFFADFPRMVTIRFVKRWFFLFMGSFYFIKPYQNNDIWANSVCSPLHFAFDSQRYPAGLMRLDLRMFQTN